MKEDYLWDKTGKDPEIEHLENALRAFRWQETAPPALPAKIIPFEAKSPFRFFRLSVAFAGFAALTLVCLGIWFQFANGKIETAQNAPETAAPQKVETLTKEVSVEKQANFPVEKPETPKQLVERKTEKVGKIAAPQIVRKNNSTVARNIKIKKPSEKLTKEETYAYNQLMLALSITGSKLKLVREKIDGIEEKNANFETDR